MFDTNPNLIQDGRSRKHAARRGAMPLVLFHDGGGTIYSYYLLDDLGRPLYGIANPRFKTGKPWAGGLYEMATAYAGLVAAAVPSGPVILGGWSLGGLLALQIAQVLSKKYTNIHVAGLVLIDSVCPIPPRGGWGEHEARLVERDVEWPATTKPETRVAVERCFSESRRMVRQWTPPTEWQEEQEPNTGVDLAADVVNNQDNAGTSYSTADKVAVTANMPPPAVLLRSQDSVPNSGDGLLFVDLHRKSHTLGWDNYRKNMFCRIVDIPGHHYSVFALAHLEAISTAVRQACQTIEDISPCTQGQGG